MCCVVAVALEACDNDVTVEERAVQLYTPVTFAGQTTQTATSNCFLSTFQQFCAVCNIMYILTDRHSFCEILDVVSDTRLHI